MLKLISLPFAYALNIHAWALLVLVIIEVLTNFLSEDLTVGQLTPNEQAAIPHRPLYNFWLGFICLGLLAAVISVDAEQQPPAARGDLSCSTACSPVQLFVANESSSSCACCGVRK